MKTLPFLLEIGTEEIPDWMIPRACDQLEELITDCFVKSELVHYADIAVTSTPRRLVFHCAGVPERQLDKQEFIQGPPESVGLRAGQFTQAALGFAKKLCVSETELFVEGTAKGKYVGVRRVTPGRRTIELLSEALPQIILSIHWPKTMYWTAERERFIRPIRWAVALLGNEVVPFEVAGVKSGNVTSGHRLLGKKEIRVTIDNYDQQLRENGVLVRAEERRRKIEDEIQALLPDGLRVKPDPPLLETLVYLTELPTPILGSFDDEYLGLPEEVLVTVMRHHQKYFSVEDSSGRLAPHFVAVMNTSADPDGLVRAGNERVLRARFNDARFFWEFDQRKKLADRIDDLAHVTWQAQLGSYLEKTNRVIALVREFGGDEHAARAAQLAKCDLTTEMVKEFPELQGVVGGLYARAQGEPEPVWRAVYEHYKPAGMEDSIPSTPEGRLVSLADKLDTLRGCFAIGLIPSGSKDPFALRRAAQGIVKILVEGKLPLQFPRFVGDSPQLYDFFLDRIQYYFRDVRGYSYDEVNAIVHARAFERNSPFLYALDMQLQLFRSNRAIFEAVARDFRRIRNILTKEGFFDKTGFRTIPGPSFDPDHLRESAEVELWQRFQAVQSEVERLRQSDNYLEALQAISTLHPVIDQYFNNVRVVVDDPGLRMIRMEMLEHVLNGFLSVADFSELVTS